MCCIQHFGTWQSSMLIQGLHRRQICGLLTNIPIFLPWSAIELRQQTFFPFSFKLCSSGTMWGSLPAIPDAEQYTQRGCC